MSNETKWTSGPWVVFTPEDYSGPRELPGLGVEAASGEAVVWYCDEPQTGLGNDADAHLIAAAPCLYEALEALLEKCHAEPHGEHERRAAITALAKARGES